MGKIYKGGQARKLDFYGREQLEEFPPKFINSVELPPALEAPTVPAPAVDPEEIRQRLMTELRAEAQERVEQAFKEGHRRGHEAGRKEFLDSTAQAAEMLKAAAREMAAARETFLASLQPQVIELVQVVCRRVLLRECTADAEIVVAIVRRALEKIADRQHLQIRISPRDHDALRRHHVSLLESFNGIEDLEIIPDESISPGGCVADSQLMHVDARLETLLQNVFESLRE